MRKRLRFTLRRAVLSALAVAVAATGVVAAGSASATGSQATKLAVVSVTDEGTGLNKPVKGKPFDVVVQSKKSTGAPAAVTKSTTVKLSVTTGTGALTGVTTAVIPKGKSTATIAGAIYSVFENGVKLKVSAIAGQALQPAFVEVNVQAVAAAAAATPGDALALTPNDCADTTPELPTCADAAVAQWRERHGVPFRGLLRRTSSRGAVRSGRRPDTARGCHLQSQGRARATRSTPAATRHFGRPVRQVRLWRRRGSSYLASSSTSSAMAISWTPPRARSKGVISPMRRRAAFCVDHRLSHRNNAGDPITYLLFAIDVRASHP